MLEKMRPKETDTDYAAKSRSVEKLLTAVRQTRDAWQKDPDGWLVNNDAEVGAARAAFLQQRTPETFQAYQAKLQVAKTMRQIPGANLLPVSDAQIFAATLDGSEKPAEELQILKKAAGSQFPQLMKNIMPKACARVNLMANNMPENSVLLVMKAMRDPNWEKNVSTMLKNRGKLDNKDLETKIAAACSQFNDSLLAGRDSPIAQGVIDLVRVLTLERMATQGYAQATAIFKAVDEVCGRYHYGSNPNFSYNFRIPANLDIGALERRAHAYLRQVDLSGFRAMFAPGMSAAPQAKTLPERIRREGYWVSNGDQVGVTLFLGSYPVVDKNGKPFNVTWDQLRRYDSGSGPYNPEDY